MDYGPASRIVGCMFAIPERYGDTVAVIEVDDDDGYPPGFVQGFLRYLVRHPHIAVSLSGFNNGGMVGEVRERACPLAQSSPVFVCESRPRSAAHRLLCMCVVV